MSGVQTRTILPAEGDMRLDRWFKQHYPQLTHGRLEKLLRTGQVRVDGGRAKANQRLEAGQTVRVPPLGEAEHTPPPKPDPKPLDPQAAKDLQRRVLYRDDWLIALDKPAGMAVQGGAKTDRHLDLMLDALRYDSEERPRLVHRLDKDTSGVLLLARTAPAARALTAAFRSKAALKEYWAVVIRTPKAAEGKIAIPLAKKAGPGGERVATDEDEGQRAETLFRLVENAGKRASWLALWPLTGRTHQLRVHCEAMGNPILGDGKYGGAEAFLSGAEIPKQVHLHARRLTLPHPSGKGRVDVTAPLPPHMVTTWRYLGFDPKPAEPLEPPDV